MSVILVALPLALLSGNRSIPPLIESDYCYQLIAVDRFLVGKGLTSLQPVAPNQPWHWQYDFGFLTQWPVGYPLLIAGVRTVLGGSSIEACRFISIVAFAAALTGWFAVIRRGVPYGITGVLLGAVAAASCLNAGFLVNPSTDLVLIAAVPFIWLLVMDASDALTRPARFDLALAGFLAGGLFWIRYASIFVPVGVTAFLLMSWLRGKLPLRQLPVFLAAAAAPILGLVLVNTVWGPNSETAAQFNLGSRIGFDFSLANLARAWWMLSGFGFYDHKPWMHWLFALMPLTILLSMISTSGRAAMGKLFASPPLQMAACLLFSLMAMLIGAATLFGAKFDYVGLERYYLPARPLYLLLFLSPLLLIPRRVVRAGLCVILLAFAWWTWFHDWSPDWARWSQAQRPGTPSGAWSRIFEPQAGQVYEWVRLTGQDSSLLIFSNFHEYVTLETGVAALPIPDSREALAQILESARGVRKVIDPRAVFVLHPDNLWRTYWLSEVSTILSEFELAPHTAAPSDLQSFVFQSTQTGGS